MTPCVIPGTLFGTAVGGPFQSLALLGALMVAGGISLVVYLVRKNRGAR